jgi:hypothetical protein
LPKERDGQEKQPKFFLPKAIGGIGYTQDQFDKIEQELASYGLELLPL